MNVFSIKALALAVRFLSVDAIERARSGHPGMPLGMADIATVLWTRFLKHSPSNPLWFNRDRFVLSNGHGSMLLYALLHLTGYPLSVDDLKNFRCLHSKTPGHPESTETPGVEATTGPLGQGLANAVGMAIAEKVLAAQFNQPGHVLVDHHTYVFIGDGCLMEGISHEAASIAGHLALGKLIVFYDDNGVSIDGNVSGWFTDNTALRFEAYGWHVVDHVDGHEPAAIEEAILAAKCDVSRPSLIVCKTKIGYGSSVEGTSKAHGSALGEQAVAQLRQRWNWHHPPFVIPDDMKSAWLHVQQGSDDEQSWLDTCCAYKLKYPALYDEFLRRINGDLPDQWMAQTNAFIEQCASREGAMATRKASAQCLNYYATLQPELLGGSADLTESNNTDWSGTRVISALTPDGNYLQYGVREFGMSAIMNGIALHGGFIPYGGTFLVFSDYARNALRLSALMKKRVIYVYTHDSIGLGEDGPTHQPIEHLAMLRMTPNLHVWRPADLMETAVAWQHALLRHHGPTCLVLSRQSLPALEHEALDREHIARGGYVIHDGSQPLDGIIIATGSELALALAVARQFSKQGVHWRVVSMPCVEVFLSNDPSYQAHVLPHRVRRRVVIEAAATAYWHRFVGLDGLVIGVDEFGLSAPGSLVFEHYGFTVDKIVLRLQQLLSETASVEALG